MLKKIGLIGGMSWESTAIYYNHLNKLARDDLGGFHSAKVLLWSFDFADITGTASSGDWHGVGDLLSDAAVRLQGAGAECILICTNTIHKVADQVSTAIDVPLIHIADATADAVKRNGGKKTALLGTKPTMEQDFYLDRMVDKHGLDIVVPDEGSRQIVHDIIFKELVFGKIHPQSKRAYLDIVSRMKADGVDGVILGCTEIGMLIKPKDLDIPTYDSTLIHAEAAFKYAQC